MNTCRIALAQINTTVGDLKGNSEKILSYIDKAKDNDVDQIIFPELSITGYPPEDLLLKKHFIEDNIKYLKKTASCVKDIIAIVGFVNRKGVSLYNSAAVLADKKIIHIYDKIHLPNYGVFDELRYFNSGKEHHIIKTMDFSFSITICEDIWAEDGPGEKDLFSKVDFLVNISASPYYLEKIGIRQNVLSKKAKKHKVPILYCNLIGAQDELVFDGRSVLFNEYGKKVVEGEAFNEDLLIVDLKVHNKKIAHAKKISNIDYKVKHKTMLLPKRPLRHISQIEEVYNALILGVRDYVRKNNFKKAALGISGGIDSAVVACIAREALSEENVLAITLPSRFSSKETQLDAELVAKNLGIDFKKIPIDDIVSVYEKALFKDFENTKPDATEENIQARIRANILMAFSNKFGYLILTTGNKSESSVGYCTLYGDMAGGFAVIKDLSKNLVYELGRFINERNKVELIPDSVFTRAPSAELRPDQKDQDTLPPYDVLDEIIKLYIVENKSFNDIIKKIGKKGVVENVLNMIDTNEYKRRQSPLGIKITSMSFGKDRRMPITNNYKEVLYGKL